MTNDTALVFSSCPDNTLAISLRLFRGTQGLDLVRVFYVAAPLRVIESALVLYSYPGFCNKCMEEMVPTCLTGMYYPSVPTHLTGAYYSVCPPTLWYLLASVVCNIHPPTLWYSLTSLVCITPILWYPPILLPCGTYPPY